MKNTLRIRISIVESDEHGEFPRERELFIERLESVELINGVRDPDEMAQYLARDIAHQIAGEFLRVRANVLGFK